MTSSSAGLTPTAEEAMSLLNVSRETADALLHFQRLVMRWTKAINLVAKGSNDTLWDRHTLDSAQVFRVVKRAPDHWLDLGSGGGFPGIICALLARDRNWSTRVTLVESDRRKATFLSTAARELNLDVTIACARIEALPPQSAEIISARALAPLPRLFELAFPHAHADSTFLFLKGARHGAEIIAAERDWRFTLIEHPSITNPDARLLECAALTKREKVDRQ